MNELIETNMNEKINMNKNA